MPWPRALAVAAEPVVWVPASSPGCFSSQGHLSKPFKRNKVTVPCEPGREPKAALLCRLGNTPAPAMPDHGRHFCPRKQLSTLLCSRLLVHWVFMIFF